MATPKRPRQSTGNQGGILQEVGPQGGKYSNYVTVPDYKPLPPTTTSGHGWKPFKITPDSRRCLSLTAAPRRGTVSTPSQFEMCP